ncbi:hypothetical protein LEP1GSC062_2520 [Leptospira alexanderi serovar Manhao 3 str. L 60]|uniref:Uncharacterized protein n=1 Tax=Leptospira alexanderi serovar Manhao 3 str. L 60 TaxID=1049759 RepID=V6I142_9LEPT|nr:hypothetical protein LEP1GSC062_2520 [Leptospira alexanderi serovar Manhao 3 str. L 60]
MCDFFEPISESTFCNGIRINELDLNRYTSNSRILKVVDIARANGGGYVEVV